MTTQTTTRLDMYGTRHDGPEIAQGPHLAYLSGDGRKARLTQAGEAICVGIATLLGHDPAYSPVTWIPVTELGLDPQLVAPPQ